MALSSWHQFIKYGVFGLYVFIIAINQVWEKRKKTY